MTGRFDAMRFGRALAVIRPSFDHGLAEIGPASRPGFDIVRPRFDRDLTVDSAEL